MRWLIALVTVLAVAYGGYWFYARGAVEDGIAAALDEMPGDRVEITHAGFGTRGFPSRFDTTIEDIAITDRLSGLTWEAPWFQVFALAYRPNEVIAVWPDEQTLTLDGEALTLFTDDMRASGRVRPNTALTFDKATVELQNPRLRRLSDGAELAMGHLIAAARATPDTDSDYDIFFEARAIVLPEWLRGVLDPAGDLAPLIRQLRLDGVATLSRQIDRFAGEGDPILLEAVQIKDLSLMWDDMSLTAIGDVTAGPDGLAEGSLTLTAANWRRALRIMVDSGLIEEGFAQTYASMGEQMDETPHIADTLTITLTFTNGQAKLGPLPVGAAPRLQF